MKIRTSFIVAVMTKTLVFTSLGFPASEESLPYSIPVQLGVSEFAPGDSIQVASMTGDRPHLESGGNYQIQGKYCLSTADTATIFLSVTAKKPPTSYSVLPGQRITVNRGAGSFTLTMKVPYDGWPHVSFYIDRREHGCIYFGEQGIESTALQVKHWSALSRVEGPSSKDRPAKVVLAENFGKEVPPPLDLDPRYSPTGIMKAFRQLAVQSDWDLKNVSVDDTEYPHLVYGVIEGRHTWEELKSALANLPGYAFAGSATSTGDKAMTFAVNLTPPKEYPLDRREAIACRLTTRLKLLVSRMPQEFAENRDAKGSHNDYTDSTYNAAGNRRLPGQ